MSKLDPAMVRLLAWIPSAFKMSLLFRFRSAPIELGVLPSRDKVLSKESLSASKLALS